VGEGADIEQKQEPIVDPTRELIERVFDPEYQREISQQKLRNLVEASIVTSALRAPRERQKQQPRLNARIFRRGETSGQLRLRQIPVSKWLLA
jgi:hypothetical protein